MASFGPSSLLGGLFNLAREIIDIFFGPSMPASTPTTERVENHDKASAKSTMIKRARKTAVKKKSPIVIDLTSEDSSDDVEIVEVGCRVYSIDLTLLPDSTPQEVAQEAARNRQKTALTFQYATKLGIAPEINNPTILKKLDKDRYQLQSAAFTKYKPQEHANTLEQLVALTENMDVRDAQMLLRNEWLNDTLIEKFFRLLASQHPKTGVISPLLSDKEDFCEKVRNNPNYIHDRASLKSANRIFMPINANSHWYLVVIDKGQDGKYTLSCMDSFNTKTGRFLKIAADFLQALFPNKSLGALVKKQQHINIPAQHNGLDCGVSISYWAREIASKNALPKHQAGTCDYSQFRFDMAEAFAKDQIKQREKDKPIKKLGPGGKLS